MKIKRIDICGFKSFVDKTSIAFTDPVTAIVGPNGCGKSNVVDAIRWVMGEQSAKHLRGRAMEDVIFSGSETRGPHGFAEVSLTFDAEGIPADAAPGGVPWGTVGPSEVVVTRRLYRSGDSEYLLGGVPCRLRDVVEFFLGTGVGSKAYAIIEQGRIGFIVSSRPEDRRGLIDEAAGITRYKVKKRAAERRMEATRQHLLRVSDVVAEIETRLRSLRLQAQKAERYKRYKAELRDIDLWAASQRFLGLLAEEKALRADLDRVRLDHEAATAALAAEEAGVEADRLAAEDERRELDRAKDEFFEISNKAQLAAARSQRVESEAEALAGRIEEARREMGELAVRVAERAGAIADLEARLVGLDEEADARVRDLRIRQEAHDEAKRELASQRDELDRRVAALGDRRTRIARGESERDAATVRMDDLGRRLDALCAEDAEDADRVAALEAEGSGLEASLDEIRARRLQAEGLRQDAEARLRALREEMERGEIELETLREEAHRRRSRLASLTEIQDRYESFQRGVRAIMQQRREAGGSGIMGVVADIVQPPPDLETAVEAVLGERLGNVIVESQDVGVDAIEFLKSKSEGRSSFIPLGVGAGAALARGGDGGGAGTVLYDATSAEMPAFIPWPTGEGVRGPMLELIGYDRRYDKVAAYLLGDVLVVEDLRKAVQLWRETRIDKTIVTLEGEVIDPHGAMTGGSREPAVAGVLGQKREIRELGEVVAKLDADYQAALGRHVSTKQRHAEVTRRLEELASAGRHDEVGLVSRQKDLDRCAGERGRLAARREEIARQLEELREGLAGTERRAGEVARALGADRGQAGDDERWIGDARERAAALAAALDDLVAHVTSLRIAAATAEDRRDSARSLRDRLRREQEEAEERIRRLQGTVEDELARVEALRAEAAEMREQSILWQAEADERARAHAERQSALEARTGELARREADLRASRASVAALASRLGALELRCQEATLKREGVEEQVAGRYPDVSLPLVVFDYHLRSLVGAAEESRQAELRGLIERMGEINLAAIEESDELSRRYELLGSQKADLESAIDQLEAAIEKINRASRKRFRDTFEAVNAKFQQVFPRLFGGGRAHLALTDPGALLETGVEIVATPPGKQMMQNIELLSGGEKALTAVSLLFAIFLVKPSPFCLLDEVDAPLDEANVGRFNEVVREMTGRSQFIMITHNRRTMEIADRLCGITMEEPGVSKLVAVKLRGRSGRKEQEERSQIASA